MNAGREIVDAVLVEVEEEIDSSASRSSCAKDVPQRAVEYKSAAKATVRRILYSQIVSE